MLIVPKTNDIAFKECINYVNLQIYKKLKL